MGLDGVEIVMRTEETFGIEIPDHVAQELQTPAALVDYVAQHVPCVSTEACLEQGEIDPLVQRGASRDDPTPLSTIARGRHGLPVRPAPLKPQLPRRRQSQRHPRASRDQSSTNRTLVIAERPTP